MNNPNTLHVNYPELITELDNLINESAIMEEIFKETESGSYMQKRYLNWLLNKAFNDIIKNKN